MDIRERIEEILRNSLPASPRKQPEVVDEILEVLKPYEQAMEHLSKVIDLHDAIEFTEVETNGFMGKNCYLSEFDSTNALFEYIHMGILGEK
jgi:hypothetical protein